MIEIICRVLNYEVLNIVLQLGVAEIVYHSSTVLMIRYARRMKIGLFNLFCRWVELAEEKEGKRSTVRSSSTTMVRPPKMV